MNKLSILIAGLVLSINTAFAENLEQLFHLKPTEKAPQSVLYIQSSTQASLKLVDAKTKAYQLTLNQVNPMVTYFSDRPTRITGQIGNSVYLQTWNQGGKESFNNNAPNAVVSGVAKVGNSSKNVNIVLELSNPVIDTKLAKITYNAKLLSSSEKTLASDAIELQFATLFIDGGVCTTCIIGG